MKKDKAICNISNSNLIRLKKSNDNNNNNNNNNNNSNNHSDTYSNDHNNAHTTIVIVIKKDMQ